MLPRQTVPWSTTIARRHKPSGAWKTYRRCLRWEFAFSCAFCLLHESDLRSAGVESYGLTSIEHFEPRSKGKGVNTYSNCFYVCRFCNGAKADSPTTGKANEKLLDPCTVIWADRFEARSFRLEFRDGDLDAGYTLELYALNDPRKIAMREGRAEIIDSVLEILDGHPDLIQRLLSAAVTTDDADARGALLDSADALRKDLSKANKEAERLSFVPADKPNSCACGAELSLSQAASAQNVALPGDW